MLDRRDGAASRKPGHASAKHAGQALSREDKQCLDSGWRNELRNCQVQQSAHAEVPPIDASKSTSRDALDIVQTPFEFPLLSLAQVIRILRVCFQFCDLR